jgi:hypothetical protein
VMRETIKSLPSENRRGQSTNPAEAAQQLLTYDGFNTVVYNAENRAVRAANGSSPGTYLRWHCPSFQDGQRRLSAPKGPK